MLSMYLEYDNVLDGIDKRYDALMKERFAEVADMLQQKVIDNIMYAKFKNPTGALAGTIQKDVDTGSSPMSVIVGPVPESPKAWALEYGGKGSYAIFPTKAAVLRFYWEKVGAVVFRPYVQHPPMMEYRYLRDALAEAEPEALGMLASVIDELLG